MRQGFRKITRAVLATAPVGLALLAMATVTRESRATVYASESFEYPEGAIGTQSGGTGWSSGWASALALTGAANATVVANGLLQPPGYGAVPAGNYLSGPAASGLVAYRGLSNTIDLSLDQDYYVSILTRRGATAKAMSVSLYTGTTTSATVAFGNSTGGQINITRSGELSLGPTGVIGYNTDISLAPTYLWVLKIAAKNGSTPDAVYLSTYRSDPNPLKAPDADPGTWSMVWAGTTNAAQESVIDRIGVSMSTSGTLNVDEIRIGTTWADVVPAVNTAWNVNADGNWSGTSNWSSVVPNSIGATATFGGIIDAPRTVTLDAAHTAGVVNFNNANSYTIAGANALTMDVSSGQAAINVLAGSHTISAPVVLNDDTTITTAASTGIALSGGVSGAGKTLTVAGSGTAQLQNVRAGGLNVNASAKIAANAIANDPVGASVVNTFAIDSSASLDLTNNSMVIDYDTVGTLVDDTRLMLQSGKLTSSSTGGKIGYGDNAVLAKGSFAGQTPDSTSLLIKFTYGGDANLDGQVDISDLGALATAWQTSAPWTGGDFDYSGFVDISDLGLLATNWQLGVGSPLGPSFDEALASVGLAGVSVPEPTALGLLGLCLAGVAWRRRRN